MRGPEYWPRLPIPPANIAEKYHQRLFAHRFLEPVAALEPMAQGDSPLLVRWPNDAVAMFGDKIWADMVCIEAHTEFSTATVAGVLDSIRNRVLNFVLELEKEAPQAGEVSVAELPISRHEIHQIFQTFVLSPVDALAIGGGDASVHNVDISVTPGDLDSLRAALAELGVPDAEIAELHSALDADRASTPDEPLGPATASWLQQVGKRAASFGKDVTAGLISSLLARYLGLP